MFRAVARHRCKSLSIVFPFLVAIAPASGAVWTNVTSSYWEYQTNWLLHALPDQSQSVVITNSGFKAVGIGANTAQNFSQSMQIQDLQIFAPADSFNELLMNFAGFTVPLQTTSVSVGSNCAVVLLSSILKVSGTNSNSGNVFVGGTFSQGDFARVQISGFMSVGRFNPNGAYYLTNGSVSTSLLEVGDIESGKFVQYGGTNNAGSLRVNNEGEYDLYGGEFTVTNGLIDGEGDFATTSSFYQYGGTIAADMVVNGIYVLNGGTRNGSLAVAESGQRVDASVLQTGGTNAASSMDMGHPNRFGGVANYTLSNGVVRVDSSLTMNGSSFSQYSGQVTIVSNLVMTAANLGSFGFVSSEYFLEGGTLSVGGVTEQGSGFSQHGGTNLIAGDLVLSGVPPAQFGPPPPGGGYGLEGGLLSVKDIYVNTNSYFYHYAGGNIIHSGVLSLNQGTWSAAAGDYTLGPLQLSGQNTKSAIIFPGGSSTLRLANSSAQPWASTGILYITNWHGSATGGGATQLYFGSNSSGLMAQQLAQMRFVFSGSLSAATILATGEVVPVASPSLEFTRNGGTLTLSWPSGWFLQSATSVTGPYQDVPGATSPSSASMTNPAAFFRLRQ